MDPDRAGVEGDGGEEELELVLEGWREWEELGAGEGDARREGEDVVEEAEARDRRPPPKSHAARRTKYKGQRTESDEVESASTQPAAPRAQGEKPVAKSHNTDSFETQASDATPPRAPPSAPASIDPSDALTPADEPSLRIMALHALMYCERLFYLEEVEEIRVADAAVYAGRRLHEEVAPLDDEATERRSVEVSSAAWGLYGKIDAVRRRDGAWVAYEHKRGRCRREDKRREAWPTDRVQAVAYAVLLEEELGQPVPQARIRYHADNVTVLVEVDDAAREELRQVVRRARELRKTTDRPPIHENENVCRRCSLNVVCLPEEERLAESSDQEPPTLFPSDRQRQALHIVSPKAYITRSQDTLVVTTEDNKQKVPIRQIDAVLIHGHGQITAQALHACAQHGVLVAWLTAGGKFVGAAPVSVGRVQQRLRQYAGLTNPETCLRLARQLVLAKVTGQLRYLLRTTRGDADNRGACQAEINRMREVLRRVPEAPSPDVLRGLEGMGAKAYFACLPRLLRPGTPPEMIPHGRSKRPPRDRFNCLLSFGYALLESLAMRSIVAVGLEPAIGFFHRPRSAAHPLVLDVMELFRTPLVEMPILGSVNRGQWDAHDDFDVRPGHVWLSDAGRKKAITLFESRLAESYQHPYTGQSLAYARMVELEVRLLEKEWTGCEGVFAQMRLR